MVTSEHDQDLLILLESAVQFVKQRVQRAGEVLHVLLSPLCLQLGAGEMVMPFYKSGGGGGGCQSH